MGTKQVRRAAVAGTLLVLASIGVAWALLGDNDQDPVEQAVADFFEARRDGDCETLVDLVAETSWSEEGSLDRDGFLVRCSELVESFQPELSSIELVSEDGERADVQISLRQDLDDETIERDELGGLSLSEPTELAPDTEGFGNPASRAIHEGTLVWEEGDWKVELDRGFLRLGPPAEQQAEETLLDYVDAYREGDCDRLIGHLTTDAWSEEGRVDRDEFLDQCADSAERRGAPAEGDPEDAVLPELSAPPLLSTEATSDGDITITTPGAEGWDTTVVLVDENMEWKLASRLEVEQYAELTARSLDEPVLDHLAPQGVATDVGAGGELAEAEGSDPALDRSDTGFERRAVRLFGEFDAGDSVAVALYEFEEGGDAVAYAEGWSDRLVSLAPGDRQDDSPVPVPGTDDGLAVVTSWCGTSPTNPANSQDCDQAYSTAALGTRGRFLVAVEVLLLEPDEDGNYPSPPTEEILDDTFEILRAQLDLLD